MSFLWVRNVIKIQEIIGNNRDHCTFNSKVYSSFLDCILYVRNFRHGNILWSFKTDNRYSEHLRWTFKLSKPYLHTILPCSSSYISWMVSCCFRLCQQSRIQLGFCFGILCVLSHDRRTCTCSCPQRYHLVCVSDSGSATRCSRKGWKKFISLEERYGR